MNAWRLGLNWRHEQLTFGNYGHTLNRRQVFSPDGSKLFYDTRNFDPDIGITERIESVSIGTGQTEVLYATPNASPFGPGVGAVACHPHRERLIFIHGLLHCNQSKPYSMSRRFGAILDLQRSGKPLAIAETRSVAKSIWGGLRGGTHAHSWSSAGNMLSFTYNDAVVAANSTASGIADLRTVGVMYCEHAAPLVEASDEENWTGCFWAGIIAPVVDRARWGSDEIEFACEECWIPDTHAASHGLQSSKIKIAFQGRVRSQQGEPVEEIFLAQLPAEPPSPLPIDSLDRNQRIALIPGTEVRRLTYSHRRGLAGISGPRNWLTASPDGQRVFALMRDQDGCAQLYSIATECDPTDHESIRQLTTLPYSIQDQVSISPDGSLVSFVANDRIHLVSLSSLQVQVLEDSFLAGASIDDARIPNRPVGAVHFSPVGGYLAWNRYVVTHGEPRLQIFVSKLDA